MLIDALTRASAKAKRFQRFTANSTQAATRRSASLHQRAHSPLRLVSPTRRNHVGHRARRRRRLNFARLARVVRGRRNRAAFSRAKRLPLCTEAPRRAWRSRRTAAGWALQRGEEKIVVASGAALIRALPPHEERVSPPSFSIAIQNPSMPPRAKCSRSRRLSERARLVASKYRRRHRRPRHVLRGGVIDVFPGDTVFPYVSTFSATKSTRYAESCPPPAKRSHHSTKRAFSPCANTASSGAALWRPRSCG